MATEFFTRFTDDPDEDLRRKRSIHGEDPEADALLGLCGISCARWFTDNPDDDDDRSFIARAYDHYAARMYQHLAVFAGYEVPAEEDAAADHVVFEPVAVIAYRSHAEWQERYSIDA